MDNNEKLVKVLIKSYFGEYNRIKKLYEKYKKGKLDAKKINEVKESVLNIKKKLDYLLEQMNEKIKATSEIGEYDKKVYEEYINLRNILTTIKEEIIAIEKEINGGQDGGSPTQT
ncbi:MAG: hypothetical protein ACP5LI_07900 [Hydrogenobaculum sp.]